ncbi:MAG: hypothetical protein WCK65_12460 [Rhodospirillaceae bacterium]
MASLVLKVSDYRDTNNWRWTLTDEGGGCLADHSVALSMDAPEWPGFIDLVNHLHHHASHDRVAADNRQTLDQFGDWLTAQAFGPIAGVLADHAPVTVRVQLPANAADLAHRPFEAARINGDALALAGVTLVFEVAGDRAKPRQSPVGAALRMLAVFSLPPQDSPLNLRRERRVLRALARELTGAQGVEVELRILQYGTTRASLNQALQ